MKLFTREELERKDIDTLKRHLRWKLGGYGVAINSIRTDNLLFRGVKCDERPKTIGRISYPPAHCVTELGRLNRVGTSMFYCSRAGPSVYFELHAKKSDCIALSRWTLTEPLWMHHVGYHADALKRMGVPVAPRMRLAYPIPNETKFNERMRRALSLASLKTLRKATSTDTNYQSLSTSGCLMTLVRCQPTTRTVLETIGRLARSTLPWDCADWLTMWLCGQSSLIGISAYSWCNGSASKRQMNNSRLIQSSILLRPESFPMAISCGMRRR